MPVYFNLKCFFVKCPNFSKIVKASKSEIISHLLQHDYTELLDEAVKFRFIKDRTERRSPCWLVEHLLEFCNEVDK